MASAVFPGCRGSSIRPPSRDTHTQVVCCSHLALLRHKPFHDREQEGSPFSLHTNTRTLLPLKLTLTPGTFAMDWRSTLYGISDPFSALLSAFLSDRPGFYSAPDIKVCVPWPGRALTPTNTTHRDTRKHAHTHTHTHTHTQALRHIHT